MLVNNINAVSRQITVAGRAAGGGYVRQAENTIL